jgi:hypothetical protein
LNKKDVLAEIENKIEQFRSSSGLNYNDIAYLQKQLDEVLEPSGQKRSFLP